MMTNQLRAHVNSDRITKYAAVVVLLALAFSAIAPLPVNVVGASNGNQTQGMQQGNQHQGRDLELYYTLRAALSTVNILLSAALIGIYMGIYRRSRSSFTLALMLFAFVLMLYALSSNPLLHEAFGFGAYGLGPFAMLPDAFAMVALLILIYLSLK
ncbi:MAG: hypothetical protein NO516_05800 [Candidatus Methanomethylicia archaeon]|nr:hypothetical protein [Candidatus Methanomethylicia archaeon]